MEVKRKSSLRKKGKGLCGFLLALCMAVTTMPALSMDAYAAPGDPAIREGTVALEGGANTNTAATVYFGQYGGNPIAWRVIGYGGTGVASGSGNITLIAKGNLAHSQFAQIGQGLAYEVSTLKQKVDEIAGNFSNGEKNVVIQRTLNNIEGPQVTDAVLWPLSTDEANSMDRGLRQADPANPGLQTSFWWLRSRGGYNNYAAFVNGYGDVPYYGHDVGIEFGVRPAFNLNLDSVLFTSAAAGGKSATVGSALTQVATYGGDEWKLTLKDTTRNGFNASFSAKTETKLFINYTGAQAGSNEYISAVVEDGGEITRYAKLKAVDGSANGSAEIDLNRIPTSSTLKVFNEQDNGDMKTDYASELKEITVPTDPTAYDVNYSLTGLTYNGEPYVVKNPTSDFTTTLISNTGYTLPANITVRVNGTELTAGTDTYSYNQATGYLEIKKEKITGKIEIIAAGVGAGSVSATDNPQIERPDLWREFIKATLHKISSAKEGETITIDFGGFNALTLSVMKQMAMRRDLSIKMVYYYKGAQYDLTFPAGMPINYSEDIPYYGPLKLADMAFRDGGVCILK